jgi:hypothetical protein
VRNDTVGGPSVHQVPLPAVPVHHEEKSARASAVLGCTLSAAVMTPETDAMPGSASQLPRLISFLVRHRAWCKSRPSRYT